MPEINILSPHVADMIAAGEVVERPASVIKEMIENSFDAGAKNVTVEIKDGGATYIRVSDDGCGMSPEDAGIAFMRHATSKLRDEKGLEAIGTMGFRGEALAAISSVSQVELRTRRHGDREGTVVTLKAGDIEDMGAVGCPEGTTIKVRSLFYNTPARLKFLKSDRSEATACINAALRCALGRPEVSVRLIRDGKEEFFTPGDGRGESCIYTLLGRDAAKDMLPIDSEFEGSRVTGFTSSPSAGRGNRAMQFFFCNGRYIRSSLLQSAVEQAYKNTLLTGRYPACVIYLALSPASVDVNVHPAKTEVKFGNERAVFDLVYHAVLSALSGEKRVPSLPRTSPAVASARKQEGTPVTKPEPKKDFYQSMSASDFRSNGYAAKSSPVPKSPSPRAVSTPSHSTSAPIYSGGGNTLRASDLPVQTRLDMEKTVKAPVFKVKSVEKERPENAPEQVIVQNSVQNVEKLPVPDHKIVGEALKTYIIVEVDGELILIDKHAAHERMIFDRLKTQDREIMSQSLLCPVTMKLSPEDGEILENNSDLLTELGFETEPFGEDTYIIRAVPADMFSDDASAAVEEIIDRLRRGKAPSPQESRDEILHTVACKAAIKAGWDTDIKELERVVTAVLSGQVKYCPHGRPVSVSVTRRDLDRMFKRIL